jgi:hypothetical protein
MDFNKLNMITVVDLTVICRCHMTLSRLDCQTRASLYTAIQNQIFLVQDAIDDDVEKAIQGGFVKHKKVRKRKEMGDSQGPSKRPRLHEEESEPIELNCEFLFWGGWGGGI